MEKHYLIAGGAGFIGSNLSRYLLNLGHRVTIWDNLSTGRLENIPKGAVFVNCDIRDECNELPLRIDGVFNLACPASPQHYQKNPIDTLMTCVIGTRNLLSMATNNNIPIFHASTSEVYGDPEISPQSESYKGSVNCTGIRSCYDEGKRAAETLCFDYNRTLGTQVKVGRIFNTYGPYMNSDDGRVVSNFITQSLRNQPITIYGDGLQTRSFCYVDDLIQGIVSLMNTDTTITGPINIGFPIESTVTVLAKTIKRLTNSESIIIYKDLPQDDPVRRCPDISLAKTLLDWSPTTDLEKGLSKTIEYFKMKCMKVGIVGGGFVGTATSHFECSNIDVFVYDINPDLCRPRGTTLESLMNCDVVMICVPTPQGHTGECDVSIVERVVSDIKKFDNHPPIVVRSTVPPGTCKRLDVSFFPEFLREVTAVEDFIATPVWIVGSTTLHSVVKDIIDTAFKAGAIKSDTVKILTTDQAEMVKYSKNCFLASKVAFCNEIYDLCNKLNIEYEKVREGFTIDTRIGSSHTQVPGPDGQRGFGGHCFPKDLSALIHVCEKNAISIPFLKGIQESNYVRTGFPESPKS